MITALGLVIAAASNPSALRTLHIGPSPLHAIVPMAAEWANGVRRAGLAQLPLTTLNSVLAVTQLADQLYASRLPTQGWRWRPALVAASVGGMNLLGCWFGAFPMCHGSGGLAAQHKFGARSGAAPIALGLAKMALGLLLGSSLLQLLRSFPAPLLGAMLAMSGLELARCAAAEQGARGVTLLLLTASGTLALGDTGLGFALGLAGAVGVFLYEAACGAYTRLARRWQAP